MDDWFSDPFFKSERSSQTDGQRRFAEVGRQLTGMFGSMMSHFQDLDRHFGLTFEEPLSSKPAERKQTNVPIVQEPDDPEQSPSPGSESYFYSAEMSTFTGPDGIAHARRKTYNSSTGKTELAEMRKLGNQAIAVRREIAPDGSVNDQIDRKNLDESEMSSFRQKWDSRRSELPNLKSDVFPALGSTSSRLSPARSRRSASTSGPRHALR
jgi:hypothetical protein